MSTYTIALTCPACGGNASLTEGARVVHCRFCDQKSLASSPLGYPTLYLPPKISQEEARLIAEKYIPPQAKLSDQPPAPPLFQQAQLLWVPFWRAQGRLIGWVSGQAPVKEEVIEEYVENGQGGGHMRKKIIQAGGEPLKKMLVHLQEYTFPAAEVKELGVLRLLWEQKTLNFLPFKPEAENKGQFISPGINLLRARREAENIFLKRVLTPYRDYTDFFHRLKLLPVQMTLFYYPLWLVKGMHEGNFIRRVIDATDGSLVAADALLPGLKESFYPATWAAAAGFLGFLASDPLRYGFWGIPTLLVLGALVYLGYRWDKRK